MESLEQFAAINTPDSISPAHVANLISDSIAEISRQIAEVTALQQQLGVALNSLHETTEQIKKDVKAVSSYVETLLTERIDAIDQNQVDLETEINLVRNRPPIVLSFAGIIPHGKNPFKGKVELEYPGLYWVEDILGFVRLDIDSQILPLDFPNVHRYGQIIEHTPGQQYIEPVDDTIFYQEFEQSIYIFRDDSLHRHTIVDIDQKLENEGIELKNKYKMLEGLLGGVSQRLLEVEQHLGLI